jgi:heme a synthase
VANRRAVSRWLFAVAGLVFAMVAVGGLTRLTRSGLSMVTWKFHGERWPQSEAEWQQTFAQYKQFPEFKK